MTPEMGFLKVGFFGSTVGCVCKDVGRTSMTNLYKQNQLKNIIYIYISSVQWASQLQNLPKVSTSFNKYVYISSTVISETFS